VSKTVIPLRLSSDRIWFYGGALVILGFLPLLLLPNMDGNRWRWSVLWGSDWSYFVGGGATAGTPNLLGPQHVAWEVAHGFIVALPWAYPPAFAWIFAPLAHASLALGFWINALFMLGACVASAVVAARIFGLPLGFSILAVFAWEPAVVSISGGQNASLALLLSLLFVFGLARGRPIVAGAAVGLLLFKPTDAAVCVLLLLLRLQWRALVVVAAACVAWYLASVPATAGDWTWPYHYAVSLFTWYPHQQYSQWLINPSALAIRLGMPALFADGISAGLLIVWCRIVTRVSLLEAASFAGLLAVATSLHANPHEAALLLPAIFYVMTNVAEPWRTRIVAIAYAIGGISILRWFIAFDPVTLLVAIGTISYLVIRLVHPHAGGVRVLTPKPAGT
jgi:Glycosyltransferase family 87